MMYLIGTGANENGGAILQPRHKAYITYDVFYNFLFN